MSFLEQLQKKRATLQSTTTIVTTTTGERYIEQCTHNTATPSTLIKLQEPPTYGFVVDTKPDINAACVLDNFLYLGSQDSVTLENLNTHQITHILSVGIEMPNIDNATTCSPPLLQLQTLFVPCLDLPETQLSASVFPIALKFIADAKRCSTGRVLVHCNAGVSRSASVVLAYLMQACDMSFEAAYALLKSKRQCIQPNAGFMRQLKSYQNKIS